MAAPQFRIEKITYQIGRNESYWGAQDINTYDHYANKLSTIGKEIQDDINQLLAFKDISTEISSLSFDGLNHALDCIHLITAAFTRYGKEPRVKQYTKKKYSLSITGLTVWLIG